ncbi:hypothetical protein [Actinoplanes sp. DH11]|uniref:hypothetical protein n=1 Tax=Actinoplanes sp. DH11 TaxID=2857011 RepID=UPI001E375A0E|nr:hypothetical protein [Actinoplanes sp. DH11]
MAARIGWAVAGLFLVAFTVSECAKHEAPATAAAVIFLGLPWLPWRPLRIAWVPLCLLVLYTFGTFVFPPFFTAGLGWLTGIATYRVVRGPEP